MFKAKIVLVTICSFAGIGVAVAFKARTINGYIKTGPLTSMYSQVPLEGGCDRIGIGCTTWHYTSTYQVYQRDFSTISTIYYPVQP